MIRLVAALATAGITLAHPELEGRIDAYLEARDWTWQQLSRGECVAGGVSINSDELQWYLINSDPVLFAECHMHDREEGGNQPWRFFKYQKSGARLVDNAIFKCAAEVGKTRDIVVKSLWLGTGNGPRARGDLLVGGALDANLDDIYDEQVWQLEQNPYLYGLVDWDRSKVKPYRKLVFKNGNRIYYRPAGHDGRAFRGVHVSLAAFLDEAALLEGKRVWREFWRALKPWAIVCIYSVPTGVRETEFYRLGLRAQAIDPHLELPVQHQLGIAVESQQERNEKLAGRERRFFLVRWPKTLMPDPYWSEARDLGYQEEYGGIDSSGYQQNVLGNDGDPTNSLFPWDRFKSCLKYIEEYREIRLLWNENDRTLHAQAWKQSATYTLEAQPGEERTRARRGASEDPEDEDGALISQPMVHISTEEFDSGNFDIRTYARSVVSKMDGHFVAGGDLASTGEDPSELLVFRVVGNVSRLVLRVQFRRFSNPSQRAGYRAVDEILRPSFGFGLDATGGGTAFEQELRHGEVDDSSEDRWSLEGRLTGYLANGNVPHRNFESGEEIEDEETGKVRMVSTKEYGTQLLERDVKAVLLELPWSPDFMTQFPNYRARITANGRVMDNKNDHLVDATRVARLRWLEMEIGSFVAAPIVHFPSGNRRPIHASRY